MNAPKVRKVPRKSKEWAVSTSPGPHSSQDSLPLSVSLRENLELVRNEREAQEILGEGQVEVDGKVRKNHRYPVGLMDVITLPKTGKSWRVFHDNKGYLQFFPIDEKKSEFKLGKVVGKVPFKGGRFQITLHDGKTIIGDFEDFKIDDTVKVSIPDLDILDRIPCEKGKTVLITGGSNVGKRGIIKDIVRMEGPSSDKFIVKSDSEEFQSPEEYVFVVGDDEPQISLPEM